jgi:carboxypeptidase family protein
VEELKYIDRLNNHLVKSSISGRVLESKYKPLPALRVVVEGMGKTYMTCTDQNGKYEISVDQPGKYVVTLVGPFSTATFSYGAEGDSRTSSGIQYKLDFVNGQCDYGEVTVFQTY